MSGILGIGIRSLMAYQSAIQIAAQNLENARTPFYSRRQISFVESMFHSGVNIGDVNRIYDDIANKSLLNSTSAMNCANKFLDSISDLEKILDNDATGINKYINDSLQSLQELTKDVGSSQIRSSYLSKLASIAARFKQIGADISQKRNDLNQNISNTVNSANNIIKQIADLSNKISGSSGEERLSLLDQRNALTHQLAQYMDFNTYTDSNDSLQISLSNGLQLISGGDYNLLSTEPDSTDGSNIKLMVNIGQNKSDITNFIKGGEIYGMMRIKTEALDAVDRGLGRLTYALSLAFNNQNKLGIDQNGNLGGNIFTDMNDPALVANRIINAATNTGTGSFAVNITDPNQLVLSDYQLVFSDATHYTLKRLSDNTTVSTGNISSYPATISVDGFSTVINSGSFNAGDTFTIKPMMSAMTKFNIVMTDPAKLALGYPVAASGQSSNMGQGQINVDQIIDTSNPAFSLNKQLNPPIKIVFLSDTSYQLVNANTNAVMEGPITYDPSKSNSIFPSPGGYDPGYRISLNGSIKSGDVFNINYNTSVTGDNRNALQLALIYTNKVLDNGKMNFNEAYHFTAGDISAKTNLAKNECESTMVMYNQANTRYNQISGVSNIEEMSDLSEYQESYQACAQVVQIAKTIFDTIINMTR